MDDAALSGEVLPPDTPGAAPSAASIALAKRISRGSPSPALEKLTEGAIGEAVAVAASYADDAISEATRAAYLRDWAHFLDWCKTKEADADELPVNPVLVAAYLGALAPTHGASALRGRAAAIAYHHRRRGVPFLSNAARRAAISPQNRSATRAASAASSATASTEKPQFGTSA